METLRPESSRWFVFSESSECPLNPRVQHTNMANFVILIPKTELGLYPENALFPLIKFVIIVTNGGRPVVPSAPPAAAAAAGNDVTIAAPGRMAAGGGYGSL